MVTDQQTNKLFLADCLLNMHSKFFEEFAAILKQTNIQYDFLPNTKDIWAVDFMPVQINRDKFVQFIYNPDYLQPKKYQKTISDTDGVCKSLGLKTKKCKLIVDGGNVLRAVDKVIMCDKIFQENKNLSVKDIIGELRDAFEVDKLYFIPWDKNDFTGHADGMVRFIDNDTVLINSTTEENQEFQQSLKIALHNAGLDWLELPYSHPDDPTHVSAEGLYLNYLHMTQAIIMPTFKNRKDEEALRILENVFKGKAVLTIDCTDIAKLGGVLNCITWNIAVE